MLSAAFWEVARRARVDVGANVIFNSPKAVHDVIAILDQPSIVLAEFAYAFCYLAWVSLAQLAE
jgi:hypothetical protein